MEISLNNLACIYLWLKHRQGKPHLLLFGVCELVLYLKYNGESDNDIYFSSSRGDPTNKLCKYTARRRKFIKIVLTVYVQLHTFCCSLLNYPSTNGH